MPYLTCPTCATPTYVVSGGDCPSCGTPLSPRPPVGPRPQRTTDPVRAKLAMACRELDADSALLSEIVGGRERVRWAAPVMKGRDEPRFGRKAVENQILGADGKGGRVRIHQHNFRDGIGIEQQQAGMSDVAADVHDAG